MEAGRAISTRTSTPSLLVPVLLANWGVYSTSSFCSRSAFTPLISSDSPIPEKATTWRSGRWNTQRPMNTFRSGVQTRPLLPARVPYHLAYHPD